MWGGFDFGNYSKEETIQGRKLYEEIRYLVMNQMKIVQTLSLKWIFQLEFMENI